jgi:hypothetical protein
MLKILTETRFRELAGFQVLKVVPKATLVA